MLNERAVFKGHKGNKKHAGMGVKESVFVMMTSIKSQKCFERVVFPRAHASAISIRTQQAKR
jgi:hypothetical protein